MVLLESALAGGAVAIFKTVMNKTTEKSLDGLSLFMNVDIRKLKAKLSIIKARLNEETISPLADESRDQLLWLSMLRDAAYDVDDVLMMCHAKSLRKQMKNKKREKEPSRSRFSYTVNKKIRGADKKLARVLENEKWLITGARTTTQTPDQTTVPNLSLKLSQIYGRKEDRETIVDHLTKNNNDQELSFIALVGLAGIGKTTLAQLVYNDSIIRSEFKTRLWVWVPPQSNVKIILDKIYGEIHTRKTVDQTSTAQKLKSICSYLSRAEKFLLILDNVWIQESQEWNRLESYLRVGSRGSKILITTQCLKVARMTQGTYIHQVKGLSDYDCWEIFSNKAFGTDGAQRFKERGMKIVSKCGGLPSAASDKPESDGWMTSVQDNEIWRLDERYNSNVLSSLKLSYRLMLPDLQQCFAYCCLFPKRYKFDKEKLTELWTLEEFIPSIQALVENKPKEHTDGLRFQTLLDMSFFQHVKKRDNDPVDAFKMHDVVQDLAWSVTGDEYLFVSGDKLSCKETCDPQLSIRYLSLICDSSSFDTLESSLREISTIRSLISLPQDSNAKLILEKGHVLLKLKLLRVLDLSSSAISELPDSVKGLKLLRLLNLSSTNITSLPDAVTKLCCLLTLNLAHCRQLKELPRGISNMRNLRHLDVYGCHSLTQMPAHIGRLELQALTMFIVGDKEGHTIGQLRNMNLISGRLQIKGLHDVKNRYEAQEAGLMEKKYLHRLELCWATNFKNVKTENVAFAFDEENALQGLQPNRNLRELMISGFTGTTLPSWLFDDELRLRDLSMINCQQALLYSLYMPSYSSFNNHMPSCNGLEKLQFSGCEALKHLPQYIVKNHIPSLRILDISHNKNLTSLVEKDFQDSRDPPKLFTTLHSLILKNCESLIHLPGWLKSLALLKSLDLCSCNQLKELNGVSVALCRNHALKYTTKTRKDWHMASITADSREAQARGGNQSPITIDLDEAQGGGGRCPMNTDSEENETDHITTDSKEAQGERDLPPRTIESEIAQRGGDRHMASIITNSQEAREGGEQNTNPEEKIKGSFSNFFRRSGFLKCVWGSKVDR